jgi:trimethylamine---corrinoid protein Co-methyltransferase
VPRSGIKLGLKPLELMTGDQLMRMHAGALDVLGNTGVRFDDPWALSFLRGYGCSVDDDLKRVCFPPELVEECLRLAPKSYAVRAPNPTNDLQLGGDILYFSHTSGMQTIDIETFEPKSVSAAEYVDCIRVLHALPTVDHLGCYPYFGYDDMPAALAIPSGVAIHMRYSDKHQMTACSNDCEIFTIQMAQAVGHEICGTIGSTPPLSWAAGAITSARRVVEAGLPLVTIDGSMMGATGPVTVAGSVIVSTVEHLAMLVLVQLLRPGCRMLVGHFSAPLNMRTGLPAFGQIGSSISNALFNQLWRSYGIPLSNGSPGYVTAKKLDYQAGYEKGIAALAAGLSGVNSMLLHLGVSSELTAHPVQAILDDDIAAMVGRFVSGEALDDEAMAVDLIKEVGPMPGQFLNELHTRNWWRREGYVPQVADTLSYPAWMEKGKKGALDYAKERMAAILSAPEQRFLSTAQETDLERILRDARAYYAARA